MSAAALVGTYLFLPESRPAGLRRKRPKRQRAAPLTISRVLTARPVITILALVTFLSFVTSSVRESILALWIASQLDFGPQAIGLIFSWNGIVVTSTQGFLIGPLAERFGERVVLRLGLSAYLIGLVGLMTSPDLPVFLISTTLNAFGTGAFASALPTMFSGHAAEGERGQIIAVYQSTGSLSRFIGPTFSGALYQIVGISAPFAFGVCALAVGLALTFLLPGATSGATKQSSGGRSGTQNPPPPPKP